MDLFRKKDKGALRSMPEISEIDKMIEKREDK